MTTERERVEQAFIDGSVEGSPVDRDGNPVGARPSPLLDDGYLVEPEPPERVPWQGWERPVVTHPRRDFLLAAIAIALLVAIVALLVSGAWERADAEEGAVGTVVSRQGTWAYANPAHGPRYLAIPEGPGWHVTVCGPKGCLDRVSTDAGPELWLQRAGRIGDLSSRDFERACGALSAGLCRGSYTILGAADQHPDDPPEHPDDNRMRVEDGGPAPTLPPTDVAP